MDDQRRNRADSFPPSSGPTTAPATAETAEPALSPLQEPHPWSCSSSAMFQTTTSRR